MFHERPLCERLVKTTQKTFSEPVASIKHPSDFHAQVSLVSSCAVAHEHEKTSSDCPKLFHPVCRHKVVCVMMLATGSPSRSKSVLQSSRCRTADRTLVMMSASFSVVLTRCSETGSCARNRKHVSAWTRRCPSLASAHRHAQRIVVSRNHHKELV